jgi:hypothetical protein
VHGSGARLLGLHMMSRGHPRIRATMLLGHTHWDHIQGFPFFGPVFQPGNEILICAPIGITGSLANVLSGQMETAYFPVELNELPAKIQYRHLAEGVFQFHGVQMRTQAMHHPAVTLGYRLESDGAAVAYMADHEPFSEVLWRPGAKPGKIESILHDGDRRHAEFMRDADLVIHDAQYTPEEMPEKKNWGHSTYEYAVELAGAAGSAAAGADAPRPLARRRQTGGDREAGAETGEIPKVRPRSVLRLRRVRGRLGTPNGQENEIRQVTVRA